MGERKKSTSSACEGRRDIGGCRRTTELVEMKHQKSGTEALGELRQVAPTKLVSYSIELANLADIISCTRSAKLAEERSPIKLAISADEKMLYETSSTIVDSYKNNIAQKIETTIEPDKNGAKIHEIRREPIEESPIKASEKKLET